MLASAKVYANAMFASAPYAPANTYHTVTLARGGSSGLQVSFMCSSASLHLAGIRIPYFIMLLLVVACGCNARLVVT
jgi:hypothetical protein